MILNLIKDKVCLTQEDLQNGLMDLGFNVTQSTVSRDIKELKLSKGTQEIDEDFF
jgi:transcriptional regulator of arginine metabolism